MTILDLFCPTKKKTVETKMKLGWHLTNPPSNQINKNLTDVLILD